MNNKSTFIFGLIIALTLLFGCASDSKTLSVSDKKLDFDNQNIGDYFDKDLILKNKYGRDIMIETLSMTGSGDFFITVGAGSQISMPKGTTHTVTIRFEPNTSGVLTGQLAISHSESEKEIFVELVGTGVPVGRIDVKDLSHDYGIVKNGTTSDYDFEIENYGTADLTIQNLAIVGPNAGLFTVTAGGSIPVTIQAGQNHFVTVQFAPILDGNFSAELQIDHTGVNKDTPITVTLDGEGKTATPEITLNISTTAVWDMGEVNINDTKTMDFEISNTGSSDLNINAIDFQTATDFAFVEVKDNNGNPLSLPQAIGVGDHIVAYVAFSPTVKGSLTDKMEITHDGINESKPLVIDVEGEGKGVAKFDSAGTHSWTVPAGVTSVKVLVVGGGGGGSGSHYGGGGSGWVVVQTVNVSPGANISVAVGAGGAGGIVGTNNSPGDPGQDSTFGSFVTATGGKGGGYNYTGGGDGGSGGGGAGNSGYGGKGGTAGSNGDPGATYPGGIGGHFDSLSGFNGSLTPGAGGAAGTSTHCGGGGAGGVLLGGNGPNGGDGGQSWSGKGGKGYGAGGGAGGYDSGTRPGGGAGADGLVYLEY